jgi:hypothetical protein
MQWAPSALRPWPNLSVLRVKAMVLTQSAGWNRFPESIN